MCMCMVHADVREFVFLNFSAADNIIEKDYSCRASDKRHLGAAKLAKYYTV